ncbi:chitin synthase regulatory factor chr2 [Gigaspora margarita]|uniref:Chitin synthase regulatory factor chr2 n=1 Tax=Gigaspora margarita TaxID=4874 RepID=A0A8H4ATW8_GIGMA|nr:chitin synthase regulatory factor chr2 [Gigaspora margarita]
MHSLTDCSAYSWVQKLHDCRKVTIIKNENLKSLSNYSQTEMERILDDKRVTLSFLPNVEYDSTDVERLKTELIPFEHENILRVFGLTYDIENMNYYIIREHANNGNMRDFLRNKHSSNYPLSWEEKQSLTYQVTKGLNFLHDNGIVHPELHPKNILMHNLTPKITNIGISKFHTSNGLPFTSYSPPEYLNKYNTIDKTKLNIYSLGVLMWEISNNGIEPFYKKYDGIKLAVEIINCARELPIKGTPLKYIDIYKKCWDTNSDERPSCSEILEELKNISYDQVYDNSNDDDIFMDNDLPINTNETVIIKDCVLNFDELENQMMKKIQFINHFSLNKGRNRDKNDFIIGKKDILNYNGKLNFIKIDNFNPIVYFAKANWKILNDFSVLSRSDNENPFSDVEIMRINIPIGVVEQHNCDLNKNFIQEIEDALNILDINEKRKKLREKFDEYGDYIITKVTIGGAIMIDCSNINVKSVSRLQAYLKWGIDYAKGEMPSIFEDESLDGFPSFTTSPPRSMKTVKDLYSWLKDLHNYKDFELISYEDYKPSYKLLSDGIKKQIVECFSLQPINKTPPVLIPQLPSDVEQKSFSEWLSLLKPSLLFYAYDWVKEFSLRYSTLVQSSKLRQGLKITFKFLREPKITPINKISVLFVQPRTQKMAYLLENNIAIKNTDDLNLNETSDDYFSLLYDPLEDSQYSNNPSLKKIWCQIKFPVAKISFDLSSIILLESCLDVVNESFEHFQQYQNLSEIFKNHYGYLLPKTFIIGGILSKSYEQDYNSINIVNSQQIDFEEKDFCFQEKLEDFLTNLSEKYNIDTSLFFSDDKVIKQNQIGCWYNTLKGNPDNWRIISLEDWRQIYNVDLNDNNYHIVFNGENSLIRDNQSELMIEFPRSLTNNDYHIYGSVIKMNKYKSWERVQEAMVTFDHTDQLRCVALIHKSDNIRLNKETTKVLWFVLAKSEGYCTNNYKDMKVTYGKIETNGIPTNVKLNNKGIYTDSVLVTSFVPKQQKIISPYHIKIKQWSSNTVVLKVKKTNENYHEKVLLHWCMIDTNGKNLVNDNKESRPWNLYGNIFNEKSRKADTDPIYYGPSELSMTPEKANELYRKLNNDSRKPLIENKDEKSPTLIKFTGYIKVAEMCHKEVIKNNTQEISRYYKESADFGEEKQEVEKYFKSSINNPNSVNLGGLLYSDENLGYEDPENRNFGYRNFEIRKFKRNIENGKTWYIQIAIKKLLETKEPPGRRDRSQEIASNNDFALKIPFAIPHISHSLFQIPEISYIHKSTTSNNENFGNNGYNHIPSLNSLLE